MAEKIVPQGYLKKLLAQGEEVLMIDHQHGFVVLGQMAGALLMGLVWVGLVTGAWYLAGSQVPHIAWAYGALVLLIPYVWWRVLAWKSRMYVITNRRIIQMSGVFNKDVLDFAIRQITDLRTHQSWVGRMFGYGDIEVLTASESGKNEIRMIAQPLEFKRAMLDAQDRNVGAEPAPAAPPAANP